MGYLTNSRPRNTLVSRPGREGPVGVVDTQPQLAKSTPSFPVRWDPTFYNNYTLGSNIQDGDTRGYTDGGWEARIVEDSPWLRSHIGHQKQEWDVGSFINNDQETWTKGSLEPFSDFTFRVSRLYAAKMTGQMFLPLPGQFMLAPGQIPRGGNALRVTDIIPGDSNPLTGIPGLQAPLGGIQNVAFDHQHQPNATGRGPIVGYKKHGLGTGTKFYSNHGMPGKSL